MIEYHIVQDGLLVGDGVCHEDAVAGVFVPDGARLFIGPAPKPTAPAPSQDARWHVHQRRWVEPVVTVDVLRARARFLRDRLLADSDWVLLRAQDQGTSVPPAWRAYRQALRDVTGQDGFPEMVVWPVKPA